MSNFEDMKSHYPIGFFKSVISEEDLLQQINKCKDKNVKAVLKGIFNRQYKNAEKKVAIPFTKKLLLLIEKALQIGKTVRLLEWNDTEGAIIFQNLEHFFRFILDNYFIQT
jgi:hypothetical protein